MSSKFLRYCITFLTLLHHVNSKILRGTLVTREVLKRNLFTIFKTEASVNTEYISYNNILQSYVVWIEKYTKLYFPFLNSIIKIFQCESFYVCLNDD